MTGRSPETTAEQITAAPAGFPSDAYRAGEAVVVPFSGRNLRVRGWQHAVWFGEPTYVTIKEFGALNVRAGSSLYTRTPDGYEEWQEQMDRDAAQREKQNMADHPETTPRRGLLARVVLGCIELSVCLVLMCALEAYAPNLVAAVVLIFAIVAPVLVIGAVGLVKLGLVSEEQVERWLSRQ